MSFKFNALTAPVIKTSTMIAFAGPSSYFPASAINVQVRFNGTNLSYTERTAVFTGTVTSVDLWDTTNNVLLQSMQVTNSARMTGSMMTFTQHAITEANRVENWFGGNFDHTNPSQIVYGGTTLSMPVYDAANVLLGYVKATGTGLTSAGMSTAIIKTLSHENASHVPVDGHFSTFGTLGTTATYLDYGLFRATNGLNGRADWVDRSITFGDDKFIATGRIGTLDGGMGNDTYVLAGYAATITDTGGVDTISTSITRSLSSLPNIENLLLTGSAAINGTGNMAANVIIGNSNANTLSGVNGADKLSGELGNDTLVGGEGNDTLLGGGGSDNLSGTNGSDTLEGGDGNDTLDGGAGQDNMLGGAGADKFVFTLASYTSSSARDIIRDFTHHATLSLSDTIDLSAIDANSKVAGNSAFAWIAKAAFGGVAGQLRASVSDLAGTANDKTTIEGDINGDKIADFKIDLVGAKALVAADFIL